MTTEQQKILAAMLVWVAVLAFVLGWVANIGYRTWIAQAHEPVAGEAPVPRDRTAAVEPGDTLWGIAQEYYPGEHTGRMVYLIREENPGIDPGRLRVGDMVRLPEVE
jgi:hypothetical protein